MFLLGKIIWCCCLLPLKPAVSMVIDPFSMASDTMPTVTQFIKVHFVPDKRPEDPISDTIFYHASRPLRWSDFQAEAPGTRRSAAVSYSSFAYEGSSLRKKDTLILNLTLQVFFIKSSSWSTPIAMDAEGLAHEQLHFDITWLVALRFQQKIRTMPLSLDDYDSMIQYEYLESFREMNRLQEAYDRDTNHGMNAAVQEQWRRNVRDALNTLNMEGALTHNPLSAASSTDSTRWMAW